MAPKPVPMPDSLRRVLDFANTVDVESGTDALGGTGGLARWLAEAGLAPAGVPVTDHQLSLALDLRTGLRASMHANNGGVPPREEVRAGEAALARLPLTATLDPADPLRCPGGDPVTAALAGLAAAYVGAVCAGVWSRLRCCPAGDCRWGFWDSSPAGSRRWCAMRVCGNRAKARAYATRRRSSIEGPAPIEDS